MAPHVLWSCADIRPIHGPCHHKGSRPLQEATMQSQMILMTSWDVPVCSNMAATVSYIPTWQLLCYSRTLQFFFFFFFYALHQGFRGPSLCATLCTTLDGRASGSLFKQKLMSLDQHAGYFFLSCSGAEDAELCDDPWIFNQPSAVFFACEVYVLFFLFSSFTTLPLNWSLDDILCRTHCLYVHAYWNCTTVYVHFSSVSNNLGPFFIVKRAKATESQLSSFI